MSDCNHRNRHLLDNFSGGTVCSICELAKTGRELAALREKCERLEGDTNDAEAMLEFLQKENSRLRTQDDYRRAETYREGLELIPKSCPVYELSGDYCEAWLPPGARCAACIARETLEKGEKG